MTTEMPWTPIAPGRARRVDADHVADFFWSVSNQGESQLILDFPTPKEDPSLPRLRGLVIAITQAGQDQSRLVLRLADESLRDVFWRLCQDIIETSRIAKGEESAAHIAIRRAWRWHHLLRGGANGLLSPEEQKGLIGEIHVLKQLLTFMEPSDALESWRGPLGAPKDFEIGLKALEAKARRSAAAPKVTINSEYQLDSDGLDLLLLHVVDVSAAVEGAGFTLTDAVRSLTGELQAIDEGLLGPVEDRLSAAGFSWAHDYSDFRWEEGQHRLYNVRDAFPRIVATDVPTGIGRVKYELDLNGLHEFEMDWPMAVRLLTEQEGAV